MIHRFCEDNDEVKVVDKYSISESKEMTHAYYTVSNVCIFIHDLYVTVDMTGINVTLLLYLVVAERVANYGSCEIPRVCYNT